MSSKQDEQKQPLLASGASTPGPGAHLADEKLRARRLLICFALMIVVGLGNRIMNVVQFTPMQNYPLFDNMLTTFAYIPASLAYIIPVIKYKPGQITKEARAVPAKVWIIMGTLDSIAGIMQSLSTNGLQKEGSLVVLLMQSAIPFSMLITKLFLKTKYKVYQYFGALLVIVGILVDLLPTLVGGNSTGGDSGVGKWAAVLMLSCVPMCLSSVYKEKALGDTDIDAVYMNFWIAVYQFIWAFPLLVPSGYASTPVVKPADLGTNLWDGMKCWVGINSIPAWSGPGAAPEGYQADDCGMAPVYVNLYILFNLAYNVLIILMLKYGSANILWLCLTLQVPIANFVFALPFMPNSQPVSWNNGVGLVIIMAGLVVYRFWTPLRAWLGRKGCLKPVEAAPVPIRDVETSSMGSSSSGSDALAIKAPAPGEQSPAISGATPILGAHAHRSKAKKDAGVGARAQAVADARARAAGDISLNGTGAGRARGPSQ